MTEKVDHPSHYNVGFEVIDLIEDLNLNFHVGNWLKYFCRHKYKGTPVEDLKKGLWYLQREKSRYHFANDILHDVPKRLRMTEYFAKSWKIHDDMLAFTVFNRVMSYVTTNNISFLENAILEMQDLIKITENEHIR